MTHAKRDSVFVLTVMFLDDDEQTFSKVIRRQRTWGWFPTLAEAEHVIDTNATDIYEEGYFNTVVLEEMPWGPLAIAKSEHWYRVIAHWTHIGHCVDKYTVSKIDKPKALGRIVSFGMG